jgi:quercetin dioxygenase-like cupin family protein
VVKKKRIMNESRYLSGKVTKSSLPTLLNANGPDVPNLKRLLLPQGELAQVHNSEDPIRYLAVFELREGGVRGNHYHHHKRESVYLIEGEITLLLQDLASGERAAVTVTAGDLVFISPGIAHALRTVHPGRGLEFAPDPLDPSDSFRHVLT